MGKIASQKDCNSAYTLLKIAKCNSRVFSPDVRFKKTVHDRLLIQRQQHLTTMAIVASLLLTTAVYANVNAAIWVRAVPISIGTLATISSLFFIRRISLMEIGAVIAALGSTTALLVPIVFNGGLTDQRALMSIPTIAIWNTLFLGIKRGNFVVGTTFLIIVLAMISQLTGLSERIRVEEIQDSNRLWVIGGQLAAVLLGIALLSKQLLLTLSIANDEKFRAIQAQQAESRFLSNMSHEIRNPLNGINGMLRSIVSDESVSTEIKEDAKLALSAATHLRAIVDDILDLKKIQEGKFEIIEEPFDAHELFRTSIALHTDLAEQKGIKFFADYDINDLPRYVIGDKKRFFQIATNVIGNAIKFTDHGSVCTQLSYKDGWLTASVIDTGIGMSKETIGKIFIPFEQGDGSIEKRFGGTGLGLSLVDAIVDATGASLTVESELGKGSKFTLVYPLKIDEEKERLWRDGKLSDSGAPTIDRFDLTGIKILCVDDSSINLKVISRPLSKAGALVTTCLSASEALQRIQSSEFDIVLTDISMPDISGEELQRQIKTQNPGIPVVATTGNVLREDVQKYLENGFVAALGKPLVIDELFEVVDRYALRT